MNEIHHFKDVVRTINGRIKGAERETYISQLLIDSRNYQGEKGTLFFALKGERFDGHDFISDLYRKGLRAFVVHTTFTYNEMDDATFVLVQDTLQALQTLAAAHRKLFDFPIVGITGSNGKTMVKEWLYQILSPFYAICKSPKSYNSQVGVPLSVWNLKPHHTLGIFEAGISQRDEMEQLAKMIQPTIGILTNIGPPHNEGFKNDEEKLNEKLKLFKKSEVLIFRKEDTWLETEIRKKVAQNVQKVAWTFDFSGAFHISGKSYSFQFPFTHHALLENAGHCVALMLHLGVKPADIQQGLSRLQTLPMRLEVKKGSGGSVLVNDSYNNDLASLEIALSYARQQNRNLPLTLVLSDVLQSGVEKEDLVAHVQKALKQHKVTAFIGIGSRLAAIQKQLGEIIPSTTFFDSTDSFLSGVEEKDFCRQLIVLKGARPFHFEKISRFLEEKNHETVWEINLSALIENINTYRRLLPKSSKIMAMVKAFAYGSGSEEIAKTLQYNRIDYFGVAFAQEGESLRKTGIDLPILVMNAAQSSFKKLVDFKLEPEMYDMDQLKDFIAYLKSKEITNFPVHLKVDTGMHRLGFSINDVDTLIEIILHAPQIKPIGIMTHLAAAEDAEEDDFTQKQITKFEEVCEKVEKALCYKPQRHLLNSAGLARFSDFTYDMARIGIGLYGIDTTGLIQAQLQQIGTLKTYVSQVKKVHPGDSVGYNRAFKATKPMAIAVLPIGYADGYDRRYSNGVGEVMVAGKRCKVIGNVCMDMTMIDVSAVKEVIPGDEVIITSPQLPITELAEKIGTIPYEVLTSISPRLKRVFYYV